MKYRKFGNLDWNVSVLGLDLMYLLENKEGSIDPVLSAIENGVNCLDTGYSPDINRYEESCKYGGRVLGAGYSNRVKVFGTYPFSAAGFDCGFDEFLEKQLKWLGIDKLDFLHLGRIDRITWPQIDEKGILGQADGALKDGRTGHIGFYFHDDYQTLRNVLEGYDNWTFAKFDYSFMDANHHPGTGGISLAASKGLAVAVSEPLKGERLLQGIPDSVSQILKEADQKKSTLQLGLEWAWNLAEVSTVLCDMRNKDRLNEGLRIAEGAEPNSLDIDEEILLRRVREKYYELRPIQCTACRCCMPCPIDIDVPRIFELYNDAVIYDDRKRCEQLCLHEQHDASRCTECGSCEDACPRRIPIMEWLKKTGF
jgi:predicted aldo/keto reductase-like oxidoreductase